MYGGFSGSEASVDADLAAVLDALARAGHDRVYRTDLSRAPFDVPVVKVQVPGLLRNDGLF